MANDFSKITIDGTTYNVKVPNKLTVGSKTFNGSEPVTIEASDLGLSNALQFIGETTETQLVDGSTTSSVKIGSTTHTAVTGDVVLYGAKEFVWQGSMWKELGDGSSHALKTISISAGDGLTGGGTLESNRTISHADTSSQASVSASGRRYITGVTLDGFGHVTGLTTGTETVTAPTVNNGTLTIQKNGTSVGTFTANQSESTTANITVPTKVSELTNDSGFLTTHQDISGLMPKSGGTFTGGVKFGSTENFQGYYIKRMIGSLGAGTAYANLDSSYKDGTWHRMWRLRFPSGSSFWGKIKITLYGGYSSFNASGVMSKSITCNFNTSNIFNNVGFYDGLGVNVEKDFRISEAIWNATASAWEVLIWQKNLNGNNSPTIMLECWTTNNTNYINAFNGITKQTVELTQSTSYSAQKASSTGGTKTVTWAALPVYENPLGEEIATVAMLEDNYVTIGTDQAITGKKTVVPPSNKDNSNQIATTAWAGRRYKSIADFGFTSQTTVKAIVQKIIDNLYTFCAFACTNDNFNNFSDTPDGYGTLIIEVGSNALRPFISFTKQIGNSNSYKHWQANIVRGANNQVTEIQWYELALKSDIPTKTSQLTNDSGFKTTDNNTTYSLSKSGSTITLTGSDGSTTSVTDANSTYSVPVNATTSAVAPSACTSNGFYYVRSSTNSLTDNDGNPFLQYHTSNSDFRILATAHSASWVQQIATDFRTEYVYIRRCDNGTWKPWTKIAQTSEIPTFNFSNGVLTITT